MVKDGGTLTVTAVSGGTLVLPGGERVALNEGENSFEI